MESKISYFLIGLVLFAQSTWAEEHLSSSNEQPLFSIETPKKRPVETTPNSVPARRWVIDEGSILTKRTEVANRYEFNLATLQNDHCYKHIALDTHYRVLEGAQKLKQLAKNVLVDGVKPSVVKNLCVDAFNLYMMDEGYKSRYWRIDFNFCNRLTNSLYYYTAAETVSASDMKLLMKHLDDLSHGAEIRFKFEAGIDEGKKSKKRDLEIPQGFGIQDIDPQCRSYKILDGLQYIKEETSELRNASCRGKDDFWEPPHICLRAVALQRFANRLSFNIIEVNPQTPNAKFASVLNDAASIGIPRIEHTCREMLSKNEPSPSLCRELKEELRELERLANEKFNLPHGVW